MAVVPFFMPQIPALRSFSAFVYFVFSALLLVPQTRAERVRELAIRKLGEERCKHIFGASYG
jgi:hypothetical protein